MKESGDSFWSSTHWRIFWRKSTEKPKRSDCNQGSSRCVPGYTRDSFSCSISPCVRFWMFSILLIGVDAKRPQIVLLILIAYLFVSNLIRSTPQAWAHWKNHETWLYLIFLLLFLFILSPFPRFSTIHVLNHSSWFPGGCLQTFHMSGNLERIRIERTLCFIQRKSI